MVERKIINDGNKGIEIFKTSDQDVGPFLAGKLDLAYTKIICAGPNSFSFYVQKAGEKITGDGFHGLLQPNAMVNLTGVLMEMFNAEIFIDASTGATSGCVFSGSLMNLGISGDGEMAAQFIRDTLEGAAPAADEAEPNWRQLVQVCFLKESIDKQLEHIDSIIHPKDKQTNPESRLPELHSLHDKALADALRFKKVLPDATDLNPLGRIMYGFMRERLDVVNDKLFHMAKDPSIRLKPGGVYMGISGFSPEQAVEAKLRELMKTDKSVAADSQMLAQLTDALDQPKSDKRDQLRKAIIQQLETLD